jgi:Tol biopolymer transport system component
LGSLEPVALAGTEGAHSLFWSPDSKYIGFFANRKLSRIGVSGGAPVPVCALPVLWSATWSPQGEIVAVQSRTATVRIRADTGVASPSHQALWPHFLPDGKQLLYVKEENNVSYVYLEDFPSGRANRLMRSDTQAIYVPASDGSRTGFVLFGVGSTLLAQRLNPELAKTEGEPVAVAEHVLYFRPTSWSEFDASPDGHLVFGAGVPSARLLLMDRSGKEIGIPGESRPYFSTARFDRSFSRIAADVYDMTQGATDLWLINRETGAGQRITFDPDVESSPVWSPDGRRLAFASASRTSPPQLRVLTLSAPGQIDAYPSGKFQLPLDWSLDGRWIAYQTTGGDRSGEIWFASESSDRNIYPGIEQEPFKHGSPAFSPNGKYLAYSADESGRPEIYVQAFDSGTPPKLTGEMHRVSLDGGTAPRWRRDGCELFFLSLEQDIMSISVNPQSSSPFGKPARLFTLPASVNTMNPTGVGFDVDQSIHG